MTTNLIKYAVFLRGINVGGNKSIKMAELKKMFEDMKFKNIKTILASGNAVLETEKDPALEQKIEEKILKTFKMEVGVIVRPVSEIQKIVDAEPFKKITVTPLTRLYVTFLKEKPKSKLKIPYESPGKDYKILSVSDHEICSFLTLTPHHGTIDAMKILEKEFGKKITTRNWNTVLKILK